MPLPHPVTLCHFCLFLSHPQRSKLIYEQPLSDCSKVVIVLVIGIYLLARKDIFITLGVKEVYQYQFSVRIGKEFNLMCCLLSIACCRSSSSKSKNGCSLKQLCKSSRTKVQPDLPAQFVEDSLSNRRVTKYEKFLSKLPKVLRSKISVANGAHLAKTEYNYWDMKRRMVPSWGIIPPLDCPPKACSDLVYPCIFYDKFK